jgi:hypothetical protein
VLLQVNWTVMKEWVAKRVTELLGIEEEVLISMIHNHLIDQVCSVAALGAAACCWLRPLVHPALYISRWQWALASQHVWVTIA